MVALAPPSTKGRQRIVPCGAEAEGMKSRGGITGGYSISDAMTLFEERGYHAQFGSAPGGLIRCFACDATHPARQVQLESMRRVEGVSDPADMCMVTALACPSCGARGTATFCFGPGCPPEDADVLRSLQDARPSSFKTPDPNTDGSLVSDSGWLRGPDSGR